MANSSEFEEQLYAEATWLYGSIVAAMFYGVVVVLTFICWCSLWPRIPSHATGYKKKRFFLCYVTFLFALGSLYIALTAEETQKAFINNRLYPGGPSAFAATAFSPTLGVTLLLSNWCADVLMIWRCVVVYRDTRFHYVILGLGIIMFTTSFVTGTLWLVIMSRPTKSTVGWMSIRFLFPYTCVALAINIFVSFLTVLRLLHHRRRISKILGPGHGAIYTSFSAIVIESASIYSTCSLLYLIPFAVHDPLSDAFLQILGEAQIIASLLIIYRVSEDKAWKHCTTLNDTVMDCSPRIRMPQIMSMTAPLGQLTVETNSDPEITRNESVRPSKSRYSRESTGEANASVSSEV